jgi:hypothetical protein
MDAHGAASSDSEGEKFEPSLFESVLNALAATAYFFFRTLAVIPFREVLFFLEEFFVPQCVLSSSQKR